MDPETLPELLLKMKQQKNQWQALHEQDLLPTREKVLKNRKRVAESFTRELLLF